MLELRAICVRVGEVTSGSGTPSDLAARVRELEQAVRGSKHERGLLLRRLIAAEDRLRAHEGAKARRQSSATTSERETPTKSIRVPVEPRKRISLPTLIAASIGIAAVAVATWYVLVQRPQETRLINQRDAARQQADAGGVELEKLRAVIAERNAQPPPVSSAPTGQPPAVPQSTPTELNLAAELAAERKALQTKSGEVENERARLAQRKREIDGESLKLEESKRRWDEARLAVPAKTPDPVQLLLPPATSIVSGSLTWRAPITGTNGGRHHRQRRQFRHHYRQPAAPTGAHEAHDRRRCHHAHRRTAA